jgi:hypothetical protein
MTAASDSLSAAERDRMLDAWRGEPSAPPGAAGAPSRTGGSLDQWATQLTHALQHRGIGSDTSSGLGRELAARLRARLRQRFGVDLPVDAILAANSAAELAKQVDAARREAVPPPMGAADRTRELPLSFGQERLWFVQQLQPESSAYNVSAAFELRGALRVPTLEQCFSAVTGRHEPLRTSFPAVAGQPVQVIAAAARAPMIVVDLGGLDDTTRAHEAARLRDRCARRPFDLAHGPLLAVGLLRLGDGVASLVTVMHHIVGDIWSMGILAREVSALYATFLDGQPSPLPPLPLQYADYAVWQRRWLEGAVLDRQLMYWRRQLTGSTSELALPVRADGDAERSRAARQAVAVDAVTAAALARVVRSQDATLFMGVLAAFQCLLAYLTRQDTFTVGTPIANRRRVELEPLVGFFVNTLVMRADLSADPTFRELVGNVRDTALDAYANPDLPFERLVAELRASGSVTHPPLFRAWFVLQNAPPVIPDFPGVTLRPTAIDGADARYDLKLDLTETDQGLEGHFEYRPGNFDDESAGALAEALVLLVQRVAHAPDTRVSDLRLLLADADEQRRVRHRTAFRTARETELRTLLRGGSAPHRRTRHDSIPAPEPTAHSRA